MTQTTPNPAPTATPAGPPATRQRPGAAKRVGYGVALAMNGLLLIVANNLLEWDWFPWLTEAWNDVLPLISFSLVASMVVNFVYLFFDDAWFKSLTQAILAAISLFVTLRVFSVFPFDFSDYGSGWETATRAILIFMMVGITIGMVAETVKFILAVARRPPATTAG